MSQELERVYTINLGKVLLSPDNIRAKRAINMVREYARRHMKTADIKIEESLSHHIWARGIKHPPRKVRVRMTKTDEGYVLVEPFEEEIESIIPEEKKPKVEETKEADPEPEDLEEESTEAETKEPEVKKEPKKTEPKKKAKAESKKETKAKAKKATKSDTKKKSKKSSK